LTRIFGGKFKKAAAITALAVAAVAVPATSAQARGSNCEIVGGGTFGIVSFTANITKNNCNYQVRAYIYTKYGLHGVDANEWYYGNTITGTGSTKAGMDVSDDPLQWGFQVNTGFGWETIATDNSVKDVFF
jgi:hypothetical protein